MPDTILNGFLQIESDQGTLTGGAPIASARSFSRLEFTSLPPNLGTNKSADIHQTSILGRSEPLKNYGSNGSRAWNLELEFFAEDDASRDVVSKVNWCESLVYPIYRNGISRGIPLLTFVFGDYINTTVICSDVTSSIPGPWTRGNTQQSLEFADPNAAQTSLEGLIGLPMYASVNLTLEHIPDTPFGHADVWTGLHNR